MRFEIGGQFFDGELLAVALVGQDQLRAFAGESLGDGVGEAPAIGDTEDEGSLAGQKLGHEFTIVAWRKLAGGRAGPIS